MISTTSALRFALVGVVVAFAVANCVTTPRPPITPVRIDDRITIGGESYHTQTRVIRWADAGGFNAYIKHRSTDPPRILPSKPSKGCDTPERYGVRPFFLDEDGNALHLTPARRRALLRDRVHQVVLHYDAAGTSRRCFEVLHDERGLSAHFLLDVDGVIYQTLDVAERARHAGPANDRSIGIEIANVGAYSTPEVLAQNRDAIVGGQNTERAIAGYVQNRRLHQYAFTDAQYTALIRLLRALRIALPNIDARIPRGADGAMLTVVLPPDRRGGFAGIVGHFHMSDNKVDPGPAFDWERLLRGLRE